MEPNCRRIYSEFLMQAGTVQGELPENLNPELAPQLN